MDLTKWEPVGGLIRWKPTFCGLDEIVDAGPRALTSTFYERPAPREKLTSIDWRPAVDIQENDREYLMEVDLSGVRREDIKVTLEDGSVVIRGERRNGGNGARIHRSERPSGNFLRSFTLPADADESKIAAEFLDGTLTIRLPKGETSRPKAQQIEIR